MTTIILNQNENEIEQLTFKVIHNSYRGSYILSVAKEFVTLHEGFSSTRFFAFADGNFNYVIAHGRKSQKKLDNFNNILEQNKNDILKLWQKKHYNLLCRCFILELQQQKLI